MTEIAIYPSLQNKVVVITGGASGIGENIVEHFIMQKSRVAFLDIEEKLGNDLVNKLDNKYNLKATFIKCNLKNINEIRKSVQLIRKQIGPIYTLVNNAANDERHDLDSVTPEYWDDRRSINLKHYFFTTQAVYKDMKKIGSGTIINIGSFSWMLAQGGTPG